MRDLGVQRRLQQSDVRAESIAMRLGSLAKLSETEIALLFRVGRSPCEVHQARSLIQTPADQPTPQRFVISGWAARMRELRDGRRQIYQLILPGDALNWLPGAAAAEIIQCLTMVQAVNGMAVTLAMRDRTMWPGVATALEQAAAQDHAFLFDHVSRLGRQSAYERMAHLFLELHFRLTPVGLVHENSIPFPLTQEAIGDLLGLSVVHVNRTLQLMRRDDVIILRQGRLTMLDMAALQTASEFRPPKTAPGFA